MHFCVFATRFHGACCVPRKYGLNWFIPALVNSSVGSSCGTTGDDGTKAWPCRCTKKSMYCWRICALVSMSRDFPGESPGLFSNARGRASEGERRALSGPLSVLGEG